MGGRSRLARGQLRIVALPLWLMSFACVSNAEHERVVHERDSLRAIVDSVKTDPAEIIAAAKRALNNGKVEDTHTILAQLGGRKLEGTLAKDVATLNDSAVALLARQGVVTAQANAAREKAHADSAKHESARLAQALGHTYTHHDDVQDMTFYYAKGITRYVNGPSQVMLYMAKPDKGSPSLHLRIRYSADEWLFVQSYTFKVDGKTFSVDPVGYDAVKRDNGSGEIWEWYTTSADAELELIKAIIASKSATLRYHGRTYVKDHTITGEEKRALQVMLDAYAVMQSAP